MKLSYGRTSIYSYIELAGTCYCKLLPTLGMCIGYLILWCGQVDPACAGSTSDPLVWWSSRRVCCSHHCDWSASSLVLFVCRLPPSWLIGSMVRLACCSTLVSSKQMGWSSVHVCLAMAGLSAWSLHPYAPSDGFLIDALSHRCTPLMLDTSTDVYEL